MTGVDGTLFNEVRIMMRITRILTLAGPNIWSRSPFLEIWLTNDASEQALPSPVDGMCGMLKDWIFGTPGQSAGASESQERFWQQIKDAASPVELFAKVALELQILAGTHVAQTFIEPAEQPNEYRAAVEFSEEAVVRLAVELAHRLLWLDRSAAPDFAECCRQLRDCARESCFGTTTGPIAAAARARGIPVTRLDGDCLLQLGHGARQRRVQGVITGATGYLAESISRDKVLTKKLMKQMGLPTAEGRLAVDPEDAWAAACEIGLPVVVKPRDADYANGVSVHLLTKAQVVAGWVLARQFRTDVLVERHLAGVPHRLLIVNDHLVAAVRRDPAHVIGDGRQTMSELIAGANRDPRRGDGPDFPWFPILIDEKLLQVLAKQGLYLSSVPPPGLFVTLQYDPKNCYAEMIRDVTECVHPEVAAAARDAVLITGLDVAGVDVMAVDITKPLAEQGGGILEVNAGPAIYLHRSPACNPPRPVPEAVVATLIPPHETGTIPIVAVLEDGLASAAAGKIGELLGRTGRSIGVSNAGGLRVGGRLIDAACANDSAGCRALLLHPRVEAAVCQLSLAGIRESGLPFDKCQVTVLARGVPGGGSDLPAAMAERCLRVVIDAVSPEGMLVVNMEDPSLPSLFYPGQERLLAVACDEQQPFLQQHSQRGGICTFADEGDAVISHGNAIILRRRLPDGAIAASSERLSQLLAVAVAWATEGTAEIVPGEPMKEMLHRRRLPHIGHPLIQAR
jgi:cyanophycin synthetase